VSWLGRWFSGKADARAHQQRLKIFRAEVIEAAASDITPERLERLEARRLELGLDEDEAAVEIEIVEGLRRVYELSQHAAADALPVVETAHRVLGDDVCYFAAPVSMVRDAGDEPGKLFLTNRRAVFLGSAVRSVAWGQIGEIAEEERDVLLLRAGGVEGHRFRCNSFWDSKGAAFVAEWLRRRANSQAGLGR
jgi:hypothetical protein